jgi:TPR repeat protein
LAKRVLSLAIALGGFTMSVAAAAMSQPRSRDTKFEQGATASQKAWAKDLMVNAERGAPEAQYRLGRAYIEGHVFKQDVGEAVKWTRAAADQGFAKAEVNLGVMYQEGKWIPRDYAQSLFWNQKAAAQGDANAEYNLGVLYAYGQGVKRDLAEGIRWYMKAAEQGHQVAAYNVGVAYSQGIGVPIDQVKGYMWQLLACHFGFAHCKETLKYLNAHLNPTKIAEARRKADDWIRTHPNVKGISM